MDNFQKYAEGLVLYRIRTAWLEISRLFNSIATDYEVTLSMGLVLLTINEEYGTLATRIAPRMGMEPNSLSRILKSLEQKGLVSRKKDKDDRRKVYICLTDSGIKMRDTALKLVFSLEGAIVKNVPAKKLATFFDVMNTVPQSIEKFKKEIEE